MSAGLCYSCGTEFGLFKKEHGCKNCGFTFCSKCLSKKIEVPRLNNSRVSVCNRCFGVLKGDIKPENTKTPPSPPLAYKKRVEALKAGSSSKTTSHRKGTAAASSSDANKYRGMAKADIEIAQRLEKLREKPADDYKKSETFEQLEDRLSVLKGMDPSRYKELNKPAFKPTDRRTQQKQVDDLLEEIAATVGLEESLPDPDQAIRDQLKRLRQNEEPNSSTLRNQDTETSMDNPNSNNTAANSNNVTNNSTNSTNNSSSNDFPPGHPYFSATQTNSFDSHCSTSSGANLSEFKIDGNNLNKTSSTLDKQCSYEKNINFCPGSSQPPVGYYGLVDPVNINALATEVKQVKEEVARNLKYSDSDNVARAGDRKSWKHFDYEEAELEREAEEIARRLTAEAMREKEEEEKSKQ